MLGLLKEKQEVSAVAAEGAGQRVLGHMPPKPRGLEEKRWNDFSLKHQLHDIKFTLTLWLSIPHL